MKKLLLTIITSLFICTQLWAQVNVSGKVTDSNGESIPGANVSIKGTSIGTVTDFNGKYTLGNVPADAILVFSFMGMLTEEVPLGGRNKVDIQLLDDFQDLEEVVIVGYGSVKRANMAGSVTDISAKELEDMPVANLSAALEAKLPGVHISFESGNPNSNSSLKIRESTTYSDVGEEPKYVIDGIVRDKEAFDLLDQSEVESISVLKDASASVYGASSAGGVVLVKTKMGRVGKMKTSYSGSYGVTQAINTTEMLSAYEHALMYNDRLVIQKVSKRAADWFTESELAYYKDSLPNGGYDWMEGAWSNATIMKHNLNVSGGTEDVKYYIGGNYLKETGNIRRLDVSKYSIKGSVEVKLLKGLTASLETSIGYRESNTPINEQDNSPTLAEGTFKALLQNPKWIPPMIDGKLVYLDKIIQNNPYVMWESDNYKNNNSNSMSYIASLNYKFPIKGLSARIQFSQSKKHELGKTYNGLAYAYNFVQEDGFHIYNINAPLDSLNPKREIQGPLYLERSTDKSQSYQANSSISYNREFGRHGINALIVCEASESNSEKVGWQKATRQIIEGYDKEWAYQDDPAGYKILYPSLSESGKLGYVGRLNYNYASKYIVEFAGRYESSTRFSPEERWGFFPSLLVGWVVSEESFFNRALDYVSFLKLRGSVGKLGNELKNDFTWMYVYSPSNGHDYLFGDNAGFTVEALNNGFINPAISWQKTDFYNGGIDVRFFNNKLSLTADAFYKYTYDILAPIASRIPTTVGATHNAKTKFNYGIMHAYGYEIDLSYRGKIFGDFGYNIRGQISFSEAKKLKVAQSPGAIDKWYDETKNFIDNQPGAISSGMVRTQAEVDDILMDNPNYTISGQQLEPGMLNYEDLRGIDESEGPNGNFSYNLTEDRTIAAEKTSPSYHYGSTIGLSWKGIKVNVTLSGIFGHEVFYDKESMAVIESNANVPSFWRDHWTPENTDAAYPRAYGYGNVGQYSTFWKRNGHTLRVSDLNVSYSLPQSWSSAIGVSQLRVYFNSKYLWTIINPLEYKDANLSRYNSYPMTRNLVGGISLSF